jgi:hypothetical protein
MPSVERSAAFHRERAAMHQSRAARHEARAAAFGGRFEGKCQMELYAGVAAGDATGVAVPVAVPEEGTSYVHAASKRYVVELPDGTEGTPTEEQARILAALLRNIAAAHAADRARSVAGFYVETRRDWSGQKWSARIECVDERGYVLRYTAGSGPLVFRRPCRMELVAGHSRTGDPPEPLQLPDELDATATRGAYVVELKGDTWGVPNYEQERLLAALLARMHRVRTLVDNARVDGLYVETLKDWDGHEWSAKLECGDDNADELYYTTHRGGTLSFWRAAAVDVAGMSCKMMLTVGRRDGATPAEYDGRAGPASAAYVVELPGKKRVAPKREQACMLARLLGQIRAERSERRGVEGLYVATHTDWNGYRWSARLDCADERGHLLLYTTMSGPLAFRRIDRADEHILAARYLTMDMAVLQSPYDRGVVETVVADEAVAAYVGRAFLGGAERELTDAQRLMAYRLVTFIGWGEYTHHDAATVRAKVDGEEATMSVENGELSTLVWRRGREHMLLTKKAAAQRGQKRALADASAPGAAGAAGAAGGALLPQGTGWFERLFGFDDATGSFAQSRAKFTYDPATGVLRALAGGGGEWRAGTFSTPTLATLRLETAARAAAPASNLTVRFVVGNVATLHDDPENAGAVFQAASQFNCLEFKHAGLTPAAGVAIYVYDPTQGPACAIACAPGTVVRNYFAGGAGQGAVQLNTIRDALDALGGGVDVTNGYTESDVARLRRLAGALRDGERRAAALELVQVGVQRDTQVTCTQRRGASYKEWRWHEATSGSVVTQVYVSAVSVAYSGVPNAAAEWAPFAQFVLEAAYEATLHVALQAAPTKNGGGRVKVFLTSVGGGVFGNDAAWIAAAIDKALRRFERAPLDVVIVEFTEGGTGLRPLLQHWLA